MQSFYRGCVLGVGLCLAPYVWCTNVTADTYSTQTVNPSSTVCMDYTFHLQLPVFNPKSTYASLHRAIARSKNHQMSQVLSQGAHAKLNQQEKSDESQPPLKNTLGSSYSVYETARVASVMIRYNC